MKKLKLFKILLIVSILYVPISVNASCIVEPIEVNVCSSGCQFNNIEEAIDYIEDRKCSSNTPATINIGEGSYIIDSMDLYRYESFTIRGAGVDKTTINYTGEVGIGIRNCGSVHLSDFTIKSRKNADAFATIGVVYIYNKAIIRNIKINSYSQYGIFTGSIREGLSIGNVDIKNASDAAIYRNECGIAYPAIIATNSNFNPESSYFNGLVNITNSDLTGNGCGVVEGSNYCDVASPINDSTSMPAEKFDKVQGDTALPDYKYTTSVRNSKLSCASATKDRNSDYTPLIYIPKTNTWVEEPEYFENVVEYNNGQVQVELEDDRTIGLNNKSGLSLTDIFKNIDSFGEKETKIEDESIIKIEENKIVPLKVGKTTATIKSGNTTYTINLRVVESINNPKTSNTTYILILVLSLVIISTFMRVMKPKKIKRCL